MKKFSIVFLVLFIIVVIVDLFLPQINWLHELLYIYIIYTIFDLLIRVLKEK